MKSSSFRAVFIRALSGSAGLQILGMASAFLVGIQLARGLGPAGYGIYGFAMSVVSLFMVPTEFGLPQLVVRETAAGWTKGEWGRIRGLLYWSASISIRLWIVICAASLLCMAIVFESLDQSLATTLLVGLSLIPLVALTKIRSAALRGLRHIVKGQLPDTLVRPTLHSLLLFSFAILAIPLTPAIAMTFGVIGAGVALAAASAMLHCALPSAAKQATPMIHAKEWRSSCMPMAMTEAMRLLQGHLAILVLGAIATAASLGVYKAATSINIVVMAPAGVFIAVVAPLISSLYVDGDLRRLQAVVSWVTGGMVAGTALLAAPIIIAAPVLIALVFGEEYEAAAMPLRVLCVGAVLTAAAGVAGTLLNMTGHEARVRRASLQSIILLAVLLPALIWWSGPLGAATATVIAGILWRALMVRDCRRLLGVDPSISGLLRAGWRRRECSNCW